MNPICGDWRLQMKTPIGTIGSAARMGDSFG